MKAGVNRREKSGNKQRSKSIRASRARANHLEKLINIQEDVLESLASLAEKVKENPLMLISEKGEMRNAESLTRAIQTATMTQRDLYGLRNIDQKFAAKKWKEEQKLQRELKAQKEETDQTGQMVVYVHVPAEEKQAEEPGKEGEKNE